METFSLSGAAGWQTLSSLLAAKTLFVGRYLWDSFTIKNTSGNVIVVAVKPGATAPGATEGLTIDVGETFTLTGRIIDGRSIWINCSGAATGFDVVIVRSEGGRR